jgi:phosphoribosylformylglycinamidine synthase subunit PurL
LAKQVELTPEEIKAQKVYRDWGLTDAEYELICHKLLKRLPNFTETGLYSGMWSEHCSYKNSKAVLRKFWTHGSRVIQGPGEGAGVLDIGDNQAVVFKAESHNHPSFVEPYEGAATGVGGIIRDIFSMGAKPIASLDSLRFGELSKGKNRFLLDKVVAGIAGYGNCIGVPTVGGEISFDSCYDGNPLVNVMCVGLMDQADLEAGRATGSGNSIIYVGAKTGRDGINGATFASSQFSSTEESDRSAVQVGDPFMEKLLVDACLEITHNHSDILVGIQDMGAAGLVSSSAEMAAKANSGVDLDLDLVPQREAEMTPYEIMLSESQERMLLCVKKGAEQTVLDVFKRNHLDAVVIGHVNDDKQYRLFHHGQLVCDIPTASLVDDVPEYQHDLKEPARLQNVKPAELPAIKDLSATVEGMLQQPTIASKKSVYRQYDSRVQANTVLAPGSDSAVVRVRGTQKSLAMTTDCNARYIYLNPKVGGQIAVAEAARNIVASGATPIGITDCLNFGDPANPESYYEMEQSAEGIAVACERFDAPVIGGNVSLYNETDGKAIYPTPLIGMVGLIEDNQYITTSSVKAAGQLLYVIGDTNDDYAGSEIQKYLTDQINGDVHFDLDTESANQELVTKLIHQHLVTSVHDLSEGGLMVGMLEMLFDQELGINGQIDLTTAQIFAETQSRFVVAVQPDQQKVFEKMVKGRAHLIGQTTADGVVNLQLTDQQYTADIKHLKTLWEEGLTCPKK